MVFAIEELLNRMDDYEITQLKLPIPPPDANKHVIQRFRREVRRVRNITSAKQARMQRCALIEKLKGQIADLQSQVQELHVELYQERLAREEAEHKAARVTQALALS